MIWHTNLTLNHKIQEMCQNELGFNNLERKVSTGFLLAVTELNRPKLNKVQLGFANLNQTVSNRFCYARIESKTVQNKQGSTGF